MTKFTEIFLTLNEMFHPHGPFGVDGGNDPENQGPKSKDHNEGKIDVIDIESQTQNVEAQVVRNDHQSYLFVEQEI